MRFMLLMLAVVAAYSAGAQERYFYGRVLDDENKGVPFAIIQSMDRHQGVYCDEHGRFSFRADPVTAKGFIFYSMGYDKVELPAKDMAADSIFVKLHQGHVSLSGVTIKAGKAEAILGKKDVGHLGDSYGKYGSEHAIWLRPDKNIGGGRGTLKEIYIYITDEGIPSTQFRVHVYKRDSVTRMPGTDITDSNIIVNAKHGNEWVKVDVSKLQIPIKGGIFISVEWVSGIGSNVMRDMSSTKNPTVTKYNGQVLGLTDDYGEKQLSYARHVLEGDKWIIFECTEYGYKPPTCVNPMIYGTYTYIE